MLYRSGVIIAILLALLLPASVHAEVHNKGLSISPVRQEMPVIAGVQTKGEYQVANFTDKPLVVSLSVEQFTAQDYTYDLIFSKPKEDWVKFDRPQITLQP